ncbi:MAG: 50S ribosomal protein L13 [Patescibacteria group bacterium]
MTATGPKQLNRAYHEIDAAGESSGRIASRAASLLIGKEKPSYHPTRDEGDFVTVLHVEKIKFTGRKLVQKDYRKHTMHPGGLKVTSMKRVFENNPDDVIKRAVYGMLPKNKFRDRIMTRLTFKD